MKKTSFLVLLTGVILSLSSCGVSSKQPELNLTLTKEQLLDKVKGGWAGQTIGCTYGGPTEFRYVGTIIQDYIPIPWSEGEVEKWYNNAPGLYDDVYVDLTFMDVFEKYGLDAPEDSFAMAFLHAGYPLDHANQMARYNLLRGLMPPASGYWKNNPHADCIDFQIEADFAGLMTPGMPNTASEICDKIGHLMSYGDGWYGGVYVAAMYSLAFVSDDINYIVSEALKVIPKESKYYQCMSDVIKWHRQYPNDWKQTWFEIERKWSEDSACPDGVHVPFNIETKVNSAYILLGLLYGQGDFFKTMDISTRAGQDSDCNPASAAGILGTMLGYDKIPAEYRNTLKPVEDRPFSHTHISLNKAYELGRKHAIDVIVKNGGQENGESVTIAYQEPKPVRLEVSFEGLALEGKEPLNKSISAFDSIQFEGKGVVLKGFIQGNGPSEYVGEVEVYLNDKLIETCKLPLFFDHRKREIFFNYDLPKDKYTLRCKWVNPITGVDVWMTEAVIYTDDVLAKK